MALECGHLQSVFILTHLPTSEPAGTREQLAAVAFQFETARFPMVTGMLALELDHGHKKG